ncbi:MAG: acetyl-CoA acetyltransferase [Microthrixaceae bacterium]
MATLPASIDPRTPVVVGVGQFLNRDDSLGLDPLTLAIEAVRRAARDCGVDSLPGRVDAIAVVPIVSWRYGDPGRRLAAELGAGPALTMYPHVGGNTPQMLLNRLAERIGVGQLDRALLCGAEAYRTRMRAKRNGVTLTWPHEDLALQPTWTEPGEFAMGHPDELALGIMMPTQCYPLFENALAHEAGRTASEQQLRCGELWEGYARVASTNPFAWDRTPYTAVEIADVTAENRIVGFPYTKHMVSNPDVDMASAAIIMSARAAADDGIDPDRWVFVHAGADAADPQLSERPSFTTSAAIRRAGTAAIDAAGIGVDDIAHIDVYSCFPSAVQIACRELGVGTNRTLTTYGGLCFAGGPWNNPVGHAIASMIDVLRDDPGTFGLITANGGNLQKHSFGVYSTSPPKAPFTAPRPQSAVDAEAWVDTDPNYAGPATIEAWTVMHERDGSIGRAHAVLRAPSGRRRWAVSIDPTVGAALEESDRIGTTATVEADSTLQLG